MKYGVVCRFNEQTCLALFNPDGAIQFGPVDLEEDDFAAMDKNELALVAVMEDSTDEEALSLQDVEHVSVDNFFTETTTVEDLIELCEVIYDRCAPSRQTLH